jgi:ferritin-like protein
MLNRIDEAIQAFEKFQNLDKGTDPRATENAQAILERLRSQ